MRANISFVQKPIVTSVKGTVIGLDIEDVVKVWRFDFSTERDFLYQKDDDAVGYLKDDFNGVPYISGLDELMEQRFAVFATEGQNRNIVFHQK